MLVINIQLQDFSVVQLDNLDAIYLMSLINKI